MKERLINERLNYLGYMIITTKVRKDRPWSRHRQDFINEMKIVSRLNKEIAFREVENAKEYVY